MFYTNFIRLCTAAGVSPSRVAEAIGSNRSQATAWKNGRQPSAKSLKKIADYFGVTVDQLTSDDLPAAAPPQTARPATAGGLSADRLRLIRLINQMDDARVADLVAFLSGKAGGNTE